MSEKVELGAGPTKFRSRRAAPKVRTGCYTCKIRRVKCDEQKPECLRCQKFGIKCSGYPKPQPHQPLIQTRLPYPALRPKSQGRSPWCPLRLASLHQPHAGPKFYDDEAYRCFQLFRSDTIPCLAGAFNDTLWGRIISQASENEPFVRDCVIAIGALSRAASVPRACPLPDCSSLVRHDVGHDKGNRSYEYAFKQYGRALKAMQLALAEKQQDLRIALIACLLVFCFESYIGNQVAAITHAQSGISLLHQSESPKFPSSSPRFEIEDELVQAFTRLDLQVSILLDTRTLSFHQAIKTESLIKLQSMPSSFTTLRQARFWCEVLMRWNYHFRAESLAVGKSQEISMKDPPVKWEDSMDTPMGATVLHEPKEIPISLLPEYRAHAAKTREWFTAFEPIFKMMKLEKENGLMGATLLHVQATMSAITLASAFFTLETGYDSFLPEFRQIISLIEEVYCYGFLSSEKRLEYRFDGGFVPPLFLAATKCRDRGVRRRAIRLLGAAPMREGVFDSVCVARMAEWIVGIEEEGMKVFEERPSTLLGKSGEEVGETDEIPDWRRLRIRRSNIDLMRRRAQLQGTVFRRADDEEPIWKEVVLNW